MDTTDTLSAHVAIETYLSTICVSISMIPRKAFMTKGLGIHQDRLASFELALRDAGIQKFNLVRVSSILPPKCSIVSRDEGLEDLSPGEIVYCVLAKNQTNEPHRLVAAAIGNAMPLDSDDYGYISEHHSFGEDETTAGEYAEDLAATMLATTLGIEFDAGSAWKDREHVYKASGHIIDTTHFCQCIHGDPEGRWTTVLAAMVFVG